MTQKPLKNQQVAEEAASWAVTLDAGSLTTEEKRALAEWLTQSALHVDELLLATSLMAGLDDVDSKKSISIEALLAEAAPNVVPLQTQTTAAPANITISSQRKKWWGFSFNQIAASFALLIIASVAFLDNITQQPGQIAFATQTGEQRSITLADGSIVHVNTRSSISVQYGETERVIEMLRGEALFEVAHDPKRPFRVHTGTTIAEAVGTTFNVRNINGQTKVAVVEGKVAVSSSQSSLDTPDAEKTSGNPPTTSQPNQSGQLLEAGELVEVNKNGHILAVTVPDMETITAWRMRKLVFKSDTLSKIAAEFNRYNREQIYLDDESVAEIEFSGVFAADDPHSFIKFLELSGTVTIDRPNRSTFRLTTPAQQALQDQEKLL